MTQPPDDANPFDPFGTMRAMRDSNMAAWSKMMQQFVNTQEYSQALAAMLDAYLTSSAPFRQALEQAMAQVLHQFNMPTRADVTSIAERLTNIEMRLDDLDAQLTALQRSAGPAAASGQAQTEPQANAAQATGPEAAAAMDPLVEQLSEADGDQAASTSPQSERGNPRAEEQQG